MWCHGLGEGFRVVKKLPPGWRKGLGQRPGGGGRQGGLAEAAGLWRLLVPRTGEPFEEIRAQFGLGARPDCAGPSGARPSAWGASGWAPPAGSGSPGTRRAGRLRSQTSGPADPRAPGPGPSPGPWRPPWRPRWRPSLPGTASARPGAGCGRPTASASSREAGRPCASPQPEEAAGRSGPRPPEPPPRLRSRSSERGKWTRPEVQVDQGGDGGLHLGGRTLLDRGARGESAVRRPSPWSALWGCTRKQGSGSYSFLQQLAKHFYYFQ